MRRKGTPSSISKVGSKKSLREFQVIREVFKSVPETFVKLLTVSGKFQVSFKAVSRSFSRFRVISVVTGGS